MPGLRSPRPHPYSLLPTPDLDIWNELVLAFSCIQDGDECVELLLLESAIEGVAPLDANLHLLLAFVHDDADLRRICINPGLGMADISLGPKPVACRLTTALSTTFSGNRALNSSALPTPFWMTTIVVFGPTAGATCSEAVGDMVIALLVQTM